MNLPNPLSNPLAGIGWALVLYLLLQLLLNLINVRVVLRHPKPARPLALVRCAFWSGVTNALFFLAAAVGLRLLGLIPSFAPEPGLWMRALLGLLLGPLLWYWLVMARGLGRRMFGSGELISADEAILRAPPSLSYVTWGVINLALIQPLGRELFVRGVFLSTVQRTLDAQGYGAHGWPLSIALMLVVDVLLRINIVWLFATIAYGLAMAALFYLTHDATCGITCSMCAGLIQGLVLLRVTMQKYREQEAAREKALLG